MVLKGYFFPFSLESLGLEVDREYRKLNEWYGKCDNFLPWLDSSEKFLNDESDPETTIPLIKEKLKTIQVPISVFKKCFCIRALYNIRQLYLVS